MHNIIILYDIYSFLRLAEPSDTSLIINKSTGLKMNLSNPWRILANLSPSCFESCKRIKIAVFLFRRVAIQQVVINGTGACSERFSIRETERERTEAK